jgi:hypothetical protein
MGVKIWRKKAFVCAIILKEGMGQPQGPYANENKELWNYLLKLSKITPS